MVTPLKDTRIIERHLFLEPFLAFVNERSPLAKRKTLKEKDLPAKQLWLLEEGHCFRDQTLKVCGLSKKPQVLANVSFASGNLETLTALVKKGGGFTLLPELAGMKLSAQDRKKHLRPFAKPIPTREVSLVHARSFLQEPILQALESCILAQLPASIHSHKTAHLKRIPL